MRLSGTLFASLAAVLLATSAMAQPAPMTGMSGGAMNAPNANGGVGIFSKENMAMMIVDLDRATKGMTTEQAATARQEEMSKHSSETPAERTTRKQMYDTEWAKLTPIEQSDALNKLRAQQAARGMMAAPPAK